MDEYTPDTELVQTSENDAAQGEQKLSGMISVVDIRFRNNAKTYFFDPDGLQLAAGDHVIIDTARGDEYGICAGGNHEVSASEIVPPLRKVLRVATAQDERVNTENLEKEKKAYDICLQKIAEHGLEMQLVSAECAFDGSKILFFFTADGRVDFRELVKDLASVFRTRIELRQIGVRDKAKMVGGLGVCGRPFCCKEFLDDFQPVSIKMAKTQNLSLNPTKISGTCGRLMCCLKYEQEAYEDLLKTAPKAESFVDTPDGRGTITEVNLLRQSVKVRMEDHPENIGCYRNCDICVLRSGKARKNDPPIPKDLAPISSKPRPAERKFAEEDNVLPELVYSDTVTSISKPASEPDEMPEQTPEMQNEQLTAAQTSKAAAHRRHRGHRGGKGSQESKTPKDAQERSEKQERPEKKEKSDRKSGRQPERKEHKNQEAKPRPTAEKPAGEKKDAAASSENKPHTAHRRHHRSRKPSGGAGSPKAES